MEIIIVTLLIVLLLVAIVTMIFAWRATAAKNNTGWMAVKYKMENLFTDIARIETTVKQEMVTNRQETGDNTQRIRTELAASLKNFGELINQTMASATTVQKDNFFALLSKQSEQNNATTARLDQMRETLEKKMAELQTGNERKLDEMRATVDEKLQKTLEARLGESFKLVSDRLEAVHKGLGDMQQLATGVGDLKRVLTNVKARGVLGEYQLESILEQILTIDQYGRNVKTKEGSNALVEFAVKLPGRGDKDKPTWLPVDSKFPKEDFEALLDAYDKALPELVEEYRKSFVKGIRKCALDISSKYVDPPNTTDFAILFLPFESLYAEVLRTPGLFESIQREYKIIITGPTTLSALLNSLQMGFRTLAIEKRSGEVWQLLGAVKTEFGNFGGILEKTQKKLQEASNVIEQAGVRSRAIEKKLRAVQELPKEDAVALIGKSNPLNIEEEHDRGSEE
ncbi:recombinase RmuC [Niastella yeongjuensis]|uniref:Recombinase RmuC n=1 Tax=Niastella yeongjuensis TaxID=354355 RepID=A0A1V9EJ12_9BACT|nr:DNA recombination protein RmuC [Niastella yeongjuensis]OQP46120.1 recombinase RmuC [Niastella yeongjuensis]SEP17290.1 DNA recombination protein RmuC [Niastella yeongjuensis]